jgi:hypothetical protein
MQFLPRFALLLSALCASACAQSDDATPAPAVYSTSAVSGLFYMQKYWIATRNLEKAIWYFAPDGVAYLNPEKGFGPDDLANHKSAAKGPYQVSGGELSVNWGDGQKSSGPLEIVDGGFNWDTGMFMPVTPFTSAAQLAGSYEGGSSVSFSGNSTIVVKALELREDGSFTWEGSASFNTDGMNTGGEGTTSGRWLLSGYTLELAADNGKVVRGVSFPQDDEATPVNPDRVYFAGISYAKR